jgi:hypothetical protein
MIACRLIGQPTGIERSRCPWQKTVTTQRPSRAELVEARRNRLGISSWLSAAQRSRNRRFQFASRINLAIDSPFRYNQNCLRLMFNHEALRLGQCSGVLHSQQNTGCACGMNGLKEKSMFDQILNLLPLGHISHLRGRKFPADHGHRASALGTSA